MRAHFLLAVSALVLSCVACGTTRVVHVRPGVLVITLEVEPSADASLPLHIFVRRRNGQVVHEDSLHSWPIALLLKPGSYLVSAMPGCSSAVTVSRAGAPGRSVAAVARVLLSGRTCDLRQIE
jgi:hypothetical protein